MKRYKHPRSPAKRRRHTNTSGRQQIRRGDTRDQVRDMARRLGVPYGKKP